MESKISKLCILAHIMLSSLYKIAHIYLLHILFVIIKFLSLQ
jgi:hypothetical protein